MAPPSCCGLMERLGFAGWPSHLTPPHGRAPTRQRPDEGSSCTEYRSHGATLGIVRPLVPSVRSRWHESWALSAGTTRCRPQHVPHRFQPRTIFVFVLCILGLLMQVVL